MTKPPTISARRISLFTRQADYFVKECGWSLRDVALGFVLACGVHKDHAVEVSTHLAEDYARKRKSKR